MTKVEVLQIWIMSSIIAAMDVEQSFFLQTQSLNPWSEANLLPLKFFSLGPLGYDLYWPIDSICIFAMLFSIWVWMRLVVRKVEP